MPPGKLEKATKGIALVQMALRKDLDSFCEPGNARLVLRQLGGCILSYQPAN